MSSTDLEQDLGRKIIAGLITSAEFLKRIQPTWFECEGFLAPELRRIGRWCFEYFEKYHSVSYGDVEQIYLSEKKRISKGEAENIKGVLETVSEEYVRGFGVSINVGALYDQTIDWFRDLQLEAHIDDVAVLREKGRLDEAEEVARNYTAPGRKLLEIHDGAKLLSKYLEKPKMLVERILPKGVIVLAGPPKLGKSLLALHLCLCIAGRFVEEKPRIIPRQLRFLGRTIEHGHALYFDLEGNEHRLKARMEKFIGDGRRINMKGFQYTFAAPSLRDGFASALQQILEADPLLRLVVIDIWAKILGLKSGSRDLYQDAITDIGELQRLANRYDVSILIVHHTNKSASAKGIDKILGSVGLAGSVDTPIVLTKVPDEEGRRRGRLEIISRDCEPSDLLLEMDPESLTWNSLGTFQEEAEQERVSEVQRWLSDVLGQRGTVSAAEIARLSDAAGYSMGRVRRAATKLGVEIKKDTQSFGGGWIWTKPTEH